MYYGRGAGKLPTASAVVADVVDCARHQGKTVMCFWDKEEVKLADVAETERAFYVRAVYSAKAEVEAAFPGGKVLTVEGRNDDFAYFTPVMKEKDFAAKCESLGDVVLSKIRLA